MCKEKLLKYNLQLFAEDDSSGANEGATKTFTQADVDNLIKKRLDRERKNLPGKEELEAFRQWKASQSKDTDQEDNNEDEENQDEADTQETDQESKKANRVKQLEQQLKQMELDHALDYAIKESGAKSAKLLKATLNMDKIFVVNGKLTGFEEQLETVRNEYSYLFGDDSNTGSWGARHTGKNNKTDGVEAAFLAKNPGLKY